MSEARKNLKAAIEHTARAAEQIKSLTDAVAQADKMLQDAQRELEIFADLETKIARWRAGELKAGRSARGGPGGYTRSRAVRVGGESAYGRRSGTSCTFDANNDDVLGRVDSTTELRATGKKGLTGGGEHIRVAERRRRGNVGRAGADPVAGVSKLPF